MKKIVTLTENDIRKLVMESVNSILNNGTFENNNDEIPAMIKPAPGEESDEIPVISYQRPGGQEEENDEIPVMSYRAGGRNMDNGIKKWVYWSFNYKDPREWMNIFDGAPASHFYKKFMDLYKRYGSNGVMNRFFVELDSKNQENLIDYVMVTQKD